MPRVSIKKNDYKVSDFSKWLRGKMASEGIRQSDLSQKLNITQPALSQKMASGSFTLKDLIIIFDVTKADAQEIERLMK